MQALARRSCAFLRGSQVPLLMRPALLSQSHCGWSYTRGSGCLAMSTSAPSSDATSPTWLALAKRSLRLGCLKALGALLCVPMAAKALTSRGRGLEPRDWSSEAPLRDPLPGLTHEWLTVNGTRLHLVRTCANEGGRKPVLLLLHGFPEGWFSWRRQMEALRGEWCVVAMDLRGYGGSDKPQGVQSYRIHHLVADVAGVMAAISGRGEARVSLVGHDWGGVVAWFVAHVHPELVDRLAVMCAPHPACFAKNMDWEQMTRSWYILAFQTPRVPEALLLRDGCALVGGMLGGEVMGCRNPGALSKEDLDRYRQAFAQPGVATAALNYYRANIESAASPSIASAMRQRLRMPTLVLWADHDVALGPQLLRGLDQHVERLRVHIVPDSSHWLQQDRWQEVNQLLTDFLNEGPAT